MDLVVSPVVKGISGVARSYDGGGYTGDGPRSGGLDGKGGFLAMVHPNETVVDHEAFADAAAAMTSASQAFAESGQAMTMATATRSANSQAKAESSAMQTAEEYFSSGSSDRHLRHLPRWRDGCGHPRRRDAIGMQSAKNAEANVYKGLKNMPAVRGRSGVK